MNREQQSPEEVNRQLWEYYAQGVEKFSRGQYVESKEDFLKVLEYDSDFSMAYVYLSAIQTDLGNYNSGIALARKGLMIDPENNYLHYCLGVGYEKKGLLDEALEQYEIYDRCIPGDAECAFSMGCTLALMERENEAVLQYKKAIELNPRHAPAYFNLAKIYELRRSEEEAIELLQRAVQVDPNYAKAWFKLGALHYKLGRYVDAVVCLEKAVEMTPKTPELHHYLALCYRDLKRFEEADQEFRAAIDACGDDPAACFQLAISHLEMDDYDLAEEAFQHCIQSDLYHMQAHYHLGSTYLLMGQLAKAKNELCFLESQGSELAKSLEALLSVWT